MRLPLHLDKRNLPSVSRVTRRARSLAELYFGALGLNPIRNLWLGFVDSWVSPGRVARMSPHLKIALEARLEEPGPISSQASPPTQGKLGALRAPDRRTRRATYAVPFVSLGDPARGVRAVGSRRLAIEESPAGDSLTPPDEAGRNVQGRGRLPLSIMHAVADSDATPNPQGATRTAGTCVRIEFAKADAPAAVDAIVTLLLRLVERR
jgi:hypothetical protein